MEITAHRGLSAREPEGTRAAYRAALDWAAATGRPLGLECDVRLSADGQLVCVHDRSLQRIAGRPTLVAELTLAHLKALDIGSWKVPRPTPEQRELLSFAELARMTVDARASGVPVGLVVDTKHRPEDGPEVEAAVAATLSAVGWDGPGSPVRLISFRPDAVERLGRLLPGLTRTLLLDKTLGEWADGHRPPGVEAVGIDLRLLRQVPDYPARVRERGGRVHVWTVNDAADARWCADLGVSGFTTDDPQVIVDALT